jgi:outer membrane protein assembly factor BamB
MAKGVYHGADGYEFGAPGELKFCCKCGDGASDGPGIPPVNRPMRPFVAFDLRSGQRSPSWGAMLFNLHRASTWLSAVLLGVLPGVAAPADPLEGDWLGTVRASANQSAEIGFGFHTKADGKLHVVFYMPEMHVFGADLGPVEETQGNVVIDDLDTRLSLVGDRIVGTFAKEALPMELTRGGSFRPEPAPVALPAGPLPLWTHPLGAGAWASPVVRDGAVYVGAVDGSFHALDAGNGRPLWEWKGGNPIYGAALASDDSVAFLDGACDLVCLGRRDGVLHWRTSLHGVTVPKNQSFNHRTATPVMAAGVVYIGSGDGAACAVDASTGSVRWRHDAGSPIYAQAALHEGRAWFGCFAGTGVDLDLATGSEVGRFTLPGQIASAPVLAGGVIIEGCRDYMLYGVRPSDGSVAWRSSFWFSWVESTPAVRDNVAYVGGSDFARITAFDPATGNVVWSTDVHGISWGTPLVTEGVVYAGTAGQLGALIRHQGSLVALDRATGSVLWRVPVEPAPDAPIFGFAGSPALSGTSVIVVAADGLVSAFPASAGR